jgi:hypothetical protein
MREATAEELHARASLAYSSSRPRFLRSEAAARLNRVRVDMNGSRYECFLVYVDKTEVVLYAGILESVCLLSLAEVQVKLIG